MNKETSNTPIRWRLPAAPDANGHHSARHVGLLSNREDFACVLLASLGHSNLAITRATGLTTGQINYRLKRAREVLEKSKMTRSAFRDGRSPFSRTLVEAAAKQIAPRIITRLRALPAPQVQGGKDDVIEV